MSSTHALSNQFDDSTTATHSEESNIRAMNRRELLTYAWGAATALLATEASVVAFQFLVPRFRAGEFGGSFDIGAASSLPPAGSLPPVANADGKFWLVHTDEGVRSLYMVCTHLGCLYNWSESNERFECPCHGSKFTLTGDYIEGPAPRSLDQFEVRVVAEGESLAATQNTDDRIIPVKIVDPAADVIVDTGNRILGKAADQSPARNAE